MPCIRSLFFFLFLVSTTANTCFGQEKISPMDIIDKAPRCYVISEMISLYIQDNRKLLENYFINYHNASMFVVGENYNSNTLSLLFNEQTVAARKDLIKSLLKIGYQADTYENIFKKLSCNKYSELIAPENILLK